METKEKSRKFAKKYWRSAVLIVLAVGFAVGAGSFNYFAQSRDFVKWASPDESANYIFAKLYGQEEN